MLNSEAKEKRIQALINRVRTVLKGMERGEWADFDTASKSIVSPIINVVSGDMDNNPLWATWSKTVQELRDIVRMAETDDRRSRNLVADIRRALMALDSGDKGVLRYIVDLPQPTVKTSGVLQDDPIYQLWEGARNELHVAVTLAVNNETFDEHISKLRKIFEEALENRFAHIVDHGGKIIESA